MDKTEGKACVMRHDSEPVYDSRHGMVLAQNRIIGEYENAPRLTGYGVSAHGIPPSPLCSGIILTVRGGAVTCRTLPGVAARAGIYIYKNTLDLKRDGRG